MNESVGIHDGRTKELIKIQENIESWVKERGYFSNIDDFIYAGKELNNKFNNYLKQWKDFPTYRFTINVLCDRLFYSCEEKELEELFEELERAGELSEASDKIITELSEGVYSRIDDVEKETIRELLKQNYPIEVIKYNIVNLQEDFVINLLAPILDLSLDEVNIFLMRVLKRDKLCSFRDNEFLLEIAIGLRDRFVYMSTIELMYLLKNYYEETKVENVKDTFANTRYIIEKSYDSIHGIKVRNRMFNLDEYPVVKELLKWHKSIEKPSSRERKDMFENLFGEVQALYREELRDFLKVSQKKERNAKEERRSLFQMPITIWYKKLEGQAPICLRKGTRFWGGRCDYFLKKDVELPQPKEEYIEVYVHVIPMEENKDLPDSGRKSVPSGVQFSIVEGNDFAANGKKIIRSVRTANKNEVDKNKYSSTKWTNPRYVSDEKRTGFVIMDVLVGEEIPTNLRISYKDFQFVLAEKMEKEYFHATIWIELDTTSGIVVSKKNQYPEDGYDVVDETNSVTKMEPLPEGVVRVSNKKRMQITHGIFDERGNFVVQDLNVRENDFEEINAIDLREIFCKYMYYKDDYEIVSNLDFKSEVKENIGLNMAIFTSDWFAHTRISVQEQWFEKLTEYQQRNVVLMLLFLKYLKKSERTALKDVQRYIRNFRSYVSKEMKKYSFDELYFGYPMDCLLMFLLASCDDEDVCDTLRFLYKAI